MEAQPLFSGAGLPKGPKGDTRSTDGVGDLWSTTVTTEVSEGVVGLEEVELFLSRLDVEEVDWERPRSNLAWGDSTGPDTSMKESRSRSLAAERDDTGL